MSTPTNHLVAFDLGHTMIGNSVDANQKSGEKKTVEGTVVDLPSFARFLYFPGGGLTHFGHVFFSLKKNKGHSS